MHAKLSFDHFLFHLANTWAAYILGFSTCGLFWYQTVITHSRCEYLSYKCNWSLNSRSIQKLNGLPHQSLLEAQSTTNVPYATLLCIHYQQSNFLKKKIIIIKKERKW